MLFHKMAGEARWVLVNHTKMEYYNGGELKEGGMGNKLLHLLRTRGWELCDDIDEDDNDEGYRKFEWMRYDGENNDGKYYEIEI